MRIIAGEFRSRVLHAPAGMATRPTSDRLRETLFNVLQPRLAGSRFLDLYAGSGANGLEAVSRGAAGAVLVEQAAPALAAIRRNVAALGVGGRVRVEGAAVQRWLNRAISVLPVERFDLVFLDPPYASAEEYEGTLNLLGGDACALLAEAAMVVVEHRREGRASGRPAAASDTLADSYGCLHRTRTLKQGEGALSIYGRDLQGGHEPVL